MNKITTKYITDIVNVAIMYGSIFNIYLLSSLISNFVSKTTSLYDVNNAIYRYCSLKVLIFIQNNENLLEKTNLHQFYYYG